MLAPPVLPPSRLRRNEQAPTPTSEVGEARFFVPGKPNEALPWAGLAEPLKRCVQGPLPPVSCHDRSGSTRCSTGRPSLEFPLLEALNPRLLEAHRERLAAATDSDCIGLQLATFKRASASMSVFDLSEMHAAMDALARL